MLYRGAEVGCCAIMYERRKGGSKEASSKGNKQRQTGRCLPVALLDEGGGLLQENQHTPTDPYKHLALSLTHSTVNGDPVVLLHTFTHCPQDEKYACMCGCMCACACILESISVSAEV